MPTTQVFLTFLLKALAYGGGSAAIAFAIFRFLGRSWIDNYFATRLEQVRHQQALEVQRLKVEIDSMLSGAVKLQDKEFDVLPEVWTKLDEAHGLVSWLVAPLQQYPNAERMNTVQLDELLAGTEFTPSQKEQVRNAHNKTDTYREIIFWHNLHRVKMAVADLQNCVARNGIFLQPELKGQLTKMSEQLLAAVVSKEIGHEAKDWKLQSEGWRKIKEETEPLYKAIESAIQARLQSHGRR